MDPNTPQSSDKNNPMDFRKYRGVIIWVVIMTVVTLLLLMNVGARDGRNEQLKSVTELEQHIRNNDVKSLRIEKRSYNIMGEYRTEGRSKQDFTTFSVTAGEPAIEPLRELCSVSNVAVSYEEPDRTLEFIGALLPWLLLGFMIYFFFIRQMRANGAGMLSFGKSRVNRIEGEKVKKTFADVAGIDEAKEEVYEIVEFLRDPDRFRRLGGRLPHGCLLIGSPGTGKTLLAKAIAGEAKVPFFSISGSDFVEMFVGVGASRVRDLFEQAKASSPCIIFLDEIDAVGRKRGSGFTGGHDEREQTLNAILVEMDGFESDESIIVIAATNRPDILDAALLRPGRFDRRIYVDLPDVNGREEILKVHSRRIKMAEDANISVVARGTPGLSGAELENIVNEAAITAARKNKPAVGMDDFEEARDKVLWGKEKRSRRSTEEERRVTAYHEAGHALANYLLPNVDPLHKVTIIQRGRALGSTMYLPEKDERNYSRKRVLARIQLLFAGRVAEELFCDDIDSGGISDFQRATNLAKHMVCDWGMTDTMGLVHYGNKSRSTFATEEDDSFAFSEATAERIDAEIRRIVDSSYEEITKLLSDNRNKLQAIAEALLEFEILTAEDVRILVDDGGMEALREHIHAVRARNATLLSEASSESHADANESSPAVSSTDEPSSTEPHTEKEPPTWSAGDQA